MKSIEFLEHTADVKFRVYGKTLDAAFANAAKALFMVVTDITKIEPKKIMSVNVSSNRLRSLLYDFLEELITLQDAEGFLLHEVETLTLDQKNNRLTARLSGDVYTGQYELASQIKAMTYSDMLVEEIDDGWMIQVVPDI